MQLINYSYIDVIQILLYEMLIGLNSFGGGCQYKHLPMAALMFADNIILISASVVDAQRLIDFYKCGLFKTY